MLRSYQFKNKTKSVTRTIRIDEDIDFQLEKLAHEQRVSVNYFANQALRKFVEWDVFADRLGFVTLPSDIFEKLVGYTTDNCNTEPRLRPKSITVLQRSSESPSQGLS